jgi:hypothetical protein
VSPEIQLSTTSQFQTSKNSEKHSTVPDYENTLLAKRSTIDDSFSTSYSSKNSLSQTSSPSDETKSTDRSATTNDVKETTTLGTTDLSSQFHEEETTMAVAKKVNFTSTDSKLADVQSTTPETDDGVKEATTLTFTELQDTTQLTDEGSTAADRRATITLRSDCHNYYNIG